MERRAADAPFETLAVPDQRYHEVQALLDRIAHALAAGDTDGMRRSGVFRRSLSTYTRRRDEDGKLRIQSVVIRGTSQVR